MDFNGNRLGSPEIIETLAGDCDGLDKLAKIYARMILNDLAASNEKGGQGEIEIQKNERKSC